MRIALIVSLLVALAAATVPAAADPGGIGFAQAEEGTWWCFGNDPVKALDCARRKCEAEGHGQTCYRTRWCFPAGWSGLMTIWLPEFHNTIPLCGAAGQAALTEAFKALCANDEVVTRCDVTTIIDPDGRVTSHDDIGWAGPTTRQED